MQDVAQLVVNSALILGGVAKYKEADKVRLEDKKNIWVSLVTVKKLF